MKKELLRINRLNYNYTRTRKLENVSFCILEGECIGFLGLSYSGKDLMTSLLRGELTEGDGSGAIYLGGQKVNDWEVLGKEIYYMCPDNYVIEDCTCNWIWNSAWNLYGKTSTGFEPYCVDKKCKRYSICYAWRFRTQ